MEVDLEMDSAKGIYIYISSGCFYVLNIRYVEGLKIIMCIVQSKYLRNKFYKILMCLSPILYVIAPMFY